jgi:hypothetical protein
MTLLRQEVRELTKKLALGAHAHTAIAEEHKENIQLETVDNLEELVAALGNKAVKLWNVNIQIVTSLVEMEIHLHR